MRNVTDYIEVGETIMHWYNGLPTLSIVVGKGASHNGKNYIHALIVEIDVKEIFVTNII